MEIRILEKLDNILRILQNKIPKDNYMDIGQVSEYSSLSRSSIRRSCQEGRLKDSCFRRKRKERKGILITDNLLKLKERFQFSNRHLGHRIEETR